MNNPSKISVLLITYNEINHIAEVIKNVDFADEIIVVDSFSTDGTLEKLAKFKHVKTICRAFTNFTEQRNFAIKQANFNWILFIDADERIPLELKNEIFEVINSNKNVAAYMFKRLYFFKKKRIRFSGFQTDTTYRLFKNGKVKYIENKLVHEMPEINGESAILKNTMLHYCFDSTAHYKSKMEHYAKLKALELHKKGKKTSVFQLLFRPFYKFVVNYFFRLGILDGKEGFQICYLSAYGVYFRYKELERLNNI
ncbi:glycosyltransferase family 2 protein [Siansivirga zeaxanthinifaciens]|uniref:Glycosyl transferase n=1 Tax=Siansivirga zeaxanthinifaciens CC-SAMT-1 TaxID=1454006 RepID=A0A0C5WC06_9FLAO|nr:glycosyltransferase family 2 protein [Siansivirga zeaxanthinifaciens]AJR04618.1 glycosyl transferase [Siansivirga zeaxanthinifaciens CC-SAMT-1]